MHASDISFGAKPKGFVEILMEAAFLRCEGSKMVYVLDEVGQHFENIVLLP